jgi:hypothetical protein
LKGKQGGIVMIRYFENGVQELMLSKIMKKAICTTDGSLDKEVFC